MRERRLYLGFCIFLFLLLLQKFLLVLNLMQMQMLMMLMTMIKYLISLLQKWVVTIYKENLLPAYNRGKTVLFHRSLVGHGWLPRPPLLPLVCALWWCDGACTRRAATAGLTSALVNIFCVPALMPGLALYTCLGVEQIVSSVICGVEPSLVCCCACIRMDKSSLFNVGWTRGVLQQVAVALVKIRLAVHASLLISWTCSSVGRVLISCRYTAACRCLA